MTASLAAQDIAASAFVEKRPLEHYVAPAKPSLVGLFARRAGAGARRSRRAGTPASHAGAADLALALCARRGRFRRDDDAVEGTARGTGATLYARAPGGRRRADLRRRHPQMVAAAAGRVRRTAARGRVRLYSGDRPRHAVHFEPGRLHAQLLVLPHRHAAAGAQPHGRRDRRPGRAGARSAERLAAGGGTGRRGAGKAPRLQRRDDGDGRAALQFRGGARRLERRRRRRRSEHLQAADHAVDLGRRAEHRPRRGRRSAPCWRSRCMR